MARNIADRQDRLAADISRQFTAPSTARFLRAMPASHGFPDLADRTRICVAGLESDVPAHLKELLDRLEASEEETQDR